MYLGRCSKHGICISGGSGERNQVDRWLHGVSMMCTVRAMVVEVLGAESPGVEAIPDSGLGLGNGVDVN